MPKPQRKSRTVYYIEALGLEWNNKKKKWEEGSQVGISKDGSISSYDSNQVRGFHTKRAALRHLRALKSQGIIAELDIWVKGRMAACVGNLPEKENPKAEAEHNVKMLRKLREGAT